MTLYNFIRQTEDGEEIIVNDINYLTTEAYFYNDEAEDVWQTDMLNLAKLLTVIRSNKTYVTVDFSDLITKKLDKLKATNLFIKCNVDAIMDDMSNILAGYVSEEWLTRFVETLKKED